MKTAGTHGAHRSSASKRKTGARLRLVAERLRAAEAESSAPGADSDLRRQIAELSQAALE